MLLQNRLPATFLPTMIFGTDPPPLSARSGVMGYVLEIDTLRFKTSEMYISDLKAASWEC